MSCYHQVPGMGSALGLALRVTGLGTDANHANQASLSLWPRKRERQPPAEVAPSQLRRRRAAQSTLRDCLDSRCGAELRGEVGAHGELDVSRSPAGRGGSMRRTADALRLSAAECRVRPSVHRASDAKEEGVTACG